MALAYLWSMLAQCFQDILQHRDQDIHTGSAMSSTSFCTNTGRVPRNGFGRSRPNPLGAGLEVCCVSDSLRSREAGLAGQPHPHSVPAEMGQVVLPSGLCQGAGDNDRWLMIQDPGAPQTPTQAQLCPETREGRERGQKGTKEGWFYSWISRFSLRSSGLLVPL